MNVQDQIRTLEAKHLALTDRSKAIFAKAGDEGRTTDDEEREEAKTNASEAAAVLEDLKLLRDLERQTIPKAVAVQGNSTEQAMAVRAGVSITAGGPVVPEGTAFTRYAMALASSRGSTFDAINMAKRWKDSTPEVLRAFEMKADPGTVADATWAAPLAVPTEPGLGVRGPAARGDRARAAQSPPRALQRADPGADRRARSWRGSVRRRRSRSASWPSRA